VKDAFEKMDKINQELEVSKSAAAELQNKDPTDNYSYKKDVLSSRYNKFMDSELHYHK